MEYRIGKVDAAVAQIDWGIRLLLDHNAYVPAITLAGAAEELLGKAVGASAAFQQLMDSLPGEYGIDPKALSQRYLNRAKNWLKHWADFSDVWVRRVFMRLSRPPSVKVL